MKLFSTVIVARRGLDNISRSVFVIAETKEEAHTKVTDYIRNDRILGAAKIKYIGLREEAVII